MVYKRLDNLLKHNRVFDKHLGKLHDMFVIRG